MYHIPLMIYVPYTINDICTVNDIFNTLTASLIIVIIIYYSHLNILLGYIGVVCVNFIH